MIVSHELYAGGITHQLLESVIASGYGGNEKVGKFVYDGRKIPLHFPKLEISRDASSKICYMQNDVVIVKKIGRRENNPIIKFNCELIDPNYHSYWNATLETVNGAYSPANDAMAAGIIVDGMYKDWYHQPVLHLPDNLLKAAMPIVLNIHDWGGANAYWDGESATFGDGDDATYFPFVSLTIVAHEISHGFTQQHSNLAYLEQSGGINESFSDMASKAAEFYATGKNQDWQLAAEIMKTNRAYRYMDNPRRDCIDWGNKKFCSIDNAKDYREDLNVHLTSGVFNKAYYLLATSVNWNTQKAFDVMVQANSAYWTEHTTFVEAACGVIEASKDYGYDIDAVASAFAQVGIDVHKC